MPLRRREKIAAPTSTPGAQADAHQDRPITKPRDGTIDANAATNVGFFDEKKGLLE
ncbi:MAG: hypothetical protein WED05_09255 [Candidatus Atabeyarchaeum deiterrae]